MPYSTESARDDIVRTGRRLGLRMRAIRSDWRRLHKTPLSAIARHDDGHFFVLAGLWDDKVLVQDPFEQRPMTLPRALFDEAWTGDVILVTRRASLLEPAARFGIGWFVPAMALFEVVLGGLRT